MKKADTQRLQDPKDPDLSLHKILSSAWTQASIALSGSSPPPNPLGLLLHHRLSTSCPLQFPPADTCSVSPLPASSLWALTSAQSPTLPVHNFILPHASLLCGHKFRCEELPLLLIQCGEYLVVLRGYSWRCSETM